METKSPFASTTLWGAVLVLLAFISMQFFGVEITPDEQGEGANRFINMVEALAGVVGWIMVVIGRFKATAKVKF
jgi:uncharacterized membrane protein